MLKSKGIPMGFTAGGTIISVGGPWSVTVLPASAAYTHDIKLKEPITGNIVDLGMTNHDTGSSFSSGTVYPAGEELRFFIHVRETGHNFYMGAASRNPDNIIHAATNQVDADTTIVTFEDIFNIGDADYNDCVLQYVSHADPSIQTGTNPAPRRYCCKDCMCSPSLN